MKALVLSSRVLSGTRSYSGSKPPLDEICSRSAVTSAWPGGSVGLRESCWADLRLLSACSGHQVALKCSHRSDIVTHA